MDSCLRGWMGTGTISKLVAGIGVRMGIRVAGTVGDGYNYLSPCSSLSRAPLVNGCVDDVLFKQVLSLTSYMDGCRILEWGTGEGHTLIITVDWDIAITCD